MSDFEEALGKPISVLIQKIEDFERENELIKKFIDAYFKIGEGRPYVMIYKIRKEMNLQREEFDNLVQKMGRKAIIEIQGGDPSKMTKQQIKDSYRDKFGYLLVCVTLR